MLIGKIALRHSRLTVVWYTMLENVYLLLTLKHFEYTEYTGCISMSEWFIYALLSAFTAALATIFAKIGLQGVDSVTATALRSVVMAALTLIVLVFWRGMEGQVTKLTQREYLFVLLSGLAGGASWILYFAALQKGEASRVALVDRSSILFVLVLATVVLHEELTVKKLVAAILVLVALVILAT